MPINSTHPEYDANIAKWKKCRTVVEGEDAVKAAGTVYLPLLNLDDNQDIVYTAYKERACFYAATGRTAEGLVGLINRKKPTVSSDWPKSKEMFLEGVTKNKIDFESFANHVTNEVMVTGRYGVLLDTVENAPAGTLPNWAGYCTESIINWRTEINEKGEEVLTMLVLKEHTYAESIEDPYVLENKVQYRKLHLVDNVYVQELWEERKGSNNKADDNFTMIGEATTPSINGVKMNHIPFVFYNTVDASTKITKPPLLDIANTNLSHYRNSADLEHGRHYTGLPTPWAAGFELKVGQSLVIGSSNAWVTDNPGASVGYLEFTGQGLKALETALEHKEQQMAILGARMLEAPKRAVEAEGTHKIRHSGEKSVLAVLATAVESAFTNALRMTLLWAGEKDSKVMAEFNKDYSVFEITPDMLNALVGMVQMGKMSFETLFWNMKRGEIIPEERDVEDEIKLIEENGFMLDKDVDDLGDEDEDSSEGGE